MGRRLPTDRAGVWLAWPWQHPHLTPPHPRWVDGTRLCAGSRCSKPPTPEGRLQLRKPRGAEAARGLAKPQVCYETLPVVETFLRDRLPHLLPRCLLPPHSSSLALFCPWVSGPDSFLSVSLSPTRSLPLQQVSSISCSGSPYQGSSPGGPKAL